MSSQKKPTKKRKASAQPDVMCGLDDINKFCRQVCGAAAPRPAFLCVLSFIQKKRQIVYPKKKRQMMGKGTKKQKQKKAATVFAPEETEKKHDVYVCYCAKCMALFVVFVCADLFFLCQLTNKTGGAMARATAIRRLKRHAVLLVASWCATSWRASARIVARLSSGAPPLTPG
jgi:hypothetical protein